MTSNTNANDNSDNYSTNSLVLNDPSDQTSGASNAKYEKIVQDYLKLRTKLTVLKKAYVDLSEQATQKDQLIRKYEQEIEGLTFRNQQQTSRVEILQRELETLKASLKSSTSNTNLAQSTSTSNLNTIQPSLSPLSVSLSSSSTSTSSSSLQSNTNHVNNTNYTNKAFEVLSEELQRKINENASLHSRLNELEAELKSRTLKLETRLRELETEKLNSERNFEKTDSQAKSLIERLQNDKIKLEVNLIQTENELKKYQLNPKLKEINNNNNHHLNSDDAKFSSNLIIEKQLENLSKIYANLNDLFSFKRVNTSHASECSQILREQLTPLLLKQIKCDSSELNSKLDAFFRFNSLLFEQIVSDLLSDSDANLEMLNKKLKIYLNKLNTLLFKDQFSLRLNQLVSLIVLNSQSQINAQFNQMFAANLSSLNDILDKLLFVLNEKLAVQHSLNYAAGLNTLDECLVSYLTQMKQGVFDLVKLVGLNSISELCARHFKLNDPIRSNEKELDRIKQTLESKDFELKQLRDKLEKDTFEQDKLKQKYDQLVTVFNQLQAKEQQQEELIQRLNSQQKQEEQNQKPLSNELDNLKIDFYIKKINGLNQQLELTDAKCLFFYEEIKSLAERLNLQTDLAHLQEVDLNEVRDQLERTRSSYETQMSTMSDHLIEVNDRMAKQVEENEKLKHEITSLQQQQQQNSSLKNAKTKKAK